MTYYQPPCTLTPTILNLVAEVSSLVGVYESNQPSTQPLYLRKADRIRTIQGTLAIEGNTLSTQQITAILEGKPVIAPPDQIQEVRNALKVYETVKEWNPTYVDDLLIAHGIMMMGLIDTPGIFRKGSAGIMKGDQVLHVAPPAQNVPALMNQLFQLLDSTDLHPLVSSSIFHYEFEFIHPFEDGNGRIGRLWQTLILSRWKPFFADLPIESLVYTHQADYYQAINQSNARGNSSPFVEFMVQIIQETLQAQTLKEKPTKKPTLTPEVEALLTVLTQPMSLKELLAQLELSDPKNLRERYLNPALKAGLIERTVPDKPNSRLQKYRRTPL